MGGAAAGASISGVAGRSGWRTGGSRLGAMRGPACAGSAARDGTAGTVGRGVPGRVTRGGGAAGAVANGAGAGLAGTGADAADGGRPGGRCGVRGRPRRRRVRSDGGQEHGCGWRRRRGRFRRQWGRCGARCRSCARCRLGPRGGERRGNGHGLDQQPQVRRLGWRQRRRGAQKQRRHRARRPRRRSARPPASPAACSAPAGCCPSRARRSGWRCRTG